MNPSLLAILLHLGGIISTIKDIEATIADLISKKSTSTDIQNLLKDIGNLFSNGIIPLPPGMTAGQISQTLSSLAAL